MFVVDASIALAWCFEDESTSSSDDVLHRLLLEGGIAPAHWPLEIANALRFAASSGRVDEDAIARARSIVTDLPIDVLPMETSTAPRPRARRERRPSAASARAVQAASSRSRGSG